PMERRAPRPRPARGGGGGAPRGPGRPLGRPPPPAARSGEGPPGGGGRGPAAPTSRSAERRPPRLDDVSITNPRSVEATARNAMRASSRRSRRGRPPRRAAYSEAGPSPVCRSATYWIHATSPSPAARLGSSSSPPDGDRGETRSDAPPTLHAAIPSGL